VPELQAGFTHLRRGTARYAGVLRADPRARPSWTCPHEHYTAVMARSCAAAEAERRRQGGSEVLALLHCEPCERWWKDEPGTRHGPYACPRCSVPLERVKFAVLERGLAT